MSHTHENCKECEYKKFNSKLDIYVCKLDDIRITFWEETNKLCLKNTLDSKNNKEK